MPRRAPESYSTQTSNLDRSSLGDVRDRLINESFADPDEGLDPDDPIDRRFAEAEAHAELRRRGESWIKFLGPRAPRYRECRFTDFQIDGEKAENKRTALAKAHEYAVTLDARVRERNNLLLYGPVGAGKDHLGVAVVRFGVWCRGAKARWINGQELFGDFRDAMDDVRGRSEADAIRALAAVELLLLSDPLPAAGELTDFQCNILYRLAEARYCAGRPTIVSINVSDGGEARRRMGAATWDRLCHGAWCVPCFWSSYRHTAN